MSLPAAAVLGSLALFLLAVRGVYRPRLGGELSDDILGVLRATVEATALLVLIQVVASADAGAARDTATLGGFAAAGLPLGRIILSGARRHAAGSGRPLRPTLILGAGKVGHMTVERLRRSTELGLEPVGFIDADPLDHGFVSSGLPVLGGPEDLAAVVERHRIQHVIVAFAQGQHESMLSAIRQCWELSLSVSLVPRLFEIEGERLDVKHVGGLPLISLRPPQTAGFALSVKYAVDRVVASLVLVVLLPPLGVIATAVAVSSGRPLFYRQLRVGRDGAPFTMWKFRTMSGSPDVLGEADADWLETQLAGEPVPPLRAVPATGLKPDRCTRVGRLLRRWSLDELPQLWNVARGEMSLIGPRPERVSYVRDLEDSIYRYPDRHRVKAGITGWAQVHGLRGETSLADRVEWDNYYIDNWSLWLDVKILLRTVGAILRGTSPPRGPRVCPREDSGGALDERAVAVWR